MRKYARYKDSGISWIGDVPEHWDVVKGKRLYKRNDGGVWGDDPKNDGSDTIVLRSTEQEQDGTLKILNPAIRQLTPNERKAGMLYAGDIIITKSSGSPSHIGKASLITRSVADMCCCYSNFIQRIRIDGEPVFYWYLLNSKVTKTQFEILSTTTTGIKNLTSTIIGNIFLSVPPLSEQKVIAEYLDKKTAQINELVSAKQKQIELLKEYKQSVIANAVTGKTDERREKINWIGYIPRHWQKRKFQYLFKERSEKNHPEEPVLCATQSRGVIPQSMYENRVVVVNTGFEGLKFVKKGDFVISLRSFQGGIEYAYYQGIISAAYTILYINTKDLYSNYVRLLFKSVPFIGLLQTCVTGIREGQNINNDLLRKQIIPIPPLSEQKEIVAYIEKKVSSIDFQIASIENQIANLNEYKQSLISYVVTGKVKVC